MQLFSKNHVEMKMAAKMLIGNQVNSYQRPFSWHGDYFDTAGTPGTSLVLKTSVFLLDPLNIILTTESQTIVFEHCRSGT